MLLKYLKSLLPESLLRLLREINNVYFDGWAIKSYSQEGEDMILRRFFIYQKNGFYVDVGAHHPKRFSNTYYFYQLGWNGINIDAMPGSMKIFNRFRRRDVNIEKPVSDKKEVLTYYMFNEPALNGFSDRLSKERNGKQGYVVEGTKEIETTTLEELLDKHLPKGQSIDFLSIDAEGFDFKILKSNNFDKYRPSLLLIEIFGNTVSDIENSEIAEFMKKQNYSIYAKTVNTVFFINNKLCSGNK